MTAITFDTLLFAKKLKTAGFTENQAEVLAETQAEILENNLVTKQDLKIELANIKADIIKWQRKIRKPIFCYFK